MSLSSTVVRAAPVVAGARRRRRPTAIQGQVETLEAAWILAWTVAVILCERFPARRLGVVAQPHAQKFEFLAVGGWQNVARLDVTIASGSEPLLQRIVSTGYEDPPTLSCRLVPGTYTVTAMADGLSGRAEFTVAEGASEAVVRVAVH